jgi:tRNA (cytidine/uridine-2'-O-)-methyltransferase
LIGLRGPHLHIVLVAPEIPQNAGSIARLAAATHSRLHLIGPLGFSLEDRYLKRAGLDYWPLVDLRSYGDWNEFARAHSTAQVKFFSTHAQTLYTDAFYARGDFLIFGCETKGLDRALLDSNVERAYRIPIFEPGVRSLNLANAVSVVVYEALRQLELLNE